MDSVVFFNFFSFHRLSSFLAVPTPTAATRAEFFPFPNTFIFWPIGRHHLAGHIHHCRLVQFFRQLLEKKYFFSIHRLLPSSSRASITTCPYRGEHSVVRNKNFGTLKFSCVKGTQRHTSPIHSNSHMPPADSDRLDRFFFPRLRGNMGR